MANNEKCNCTHHFREELTDAQLEQVTGGTYYAAKCSSCGFIPSGMGEYANQAWAEQKADFWNNEGCPNGCGKGKFIIISADSLWDLI